ncbi:unnamed protein product [Plutella xylostella]|uniref:(diamondback moth) hypothetical protein n=1 Tax=Plutella xylostella TaxID=51655 RepID=A0A8S4FV62_PLUXY|nr:unnamed protein product [Plutella xylostella]
MSDSGSENDGKEVQLNSSSESSYDEEETGQRETEPHETDDRTLVQTYAKEMAASETSPEAPPLPRRKKFIPKYEVEGVHKVILTEDTQTLIGMFVGTDIIAQYPWKMVPKERIMDSIDLSHENSEFYHLKADLEAYEDEEILMGYIVDDSRNNDEFYICVTLEARDHCQEQSDRFIRRQEKKLEKAIQKKPRPWVSLGSELELTELIPINTRSLIEVEIKSKFPTTYDPAMFSVRDTHSVRDGCIELTPYREKYNLVNRRRIDTEIQAAASKCDREAQTELRYPQNMWTQSIADALGSVTEDEAGGDTAKIDDEIVEKEDDGSSSEDEAKPQVDEVAWQDNWLETNPHILLEIKQKEALLLAEKEAEKLLLREQEEKRIEDAAEAKRLEKLKVVGPEEKWQQIIQKLTERTIAVKKRINRAELIEQEKPLRDLEAQRLEKERRMHDIMKNQKNIFNDTVAILFPEAIKKKEKPKKTYLVDDKDKLKRDYLETYSILKSDALQTVHNNPYVVEFSWEATLAEGKDRREALTASNEIIKIHKTRIEIDGGISLNEQSLQSVKDDGSLYGEDVQEQDVISNEIKVEKETSELKDVEKKSKKGKGVKVKLDKVKTKKVESELIKDEQMDAETKEEPTLL